MSASMLVGLMVLGPVIVGVGLGIIGAIIAAFTGGGRK